MTSLEANNNLKLRSFRDPDGFVAYAGGEVVTRFLSASGRHRLPDIASLRTVQDFQVRGEWIGTESSLAGSDCVTHPRVMFPSYPHEWCPSMLYRSAELCLRINAALLEEGWELKDATPANVLFEGPRPVFVDHMSPVRRQPHTLGWQAYGQFVRTFLIPLLLHTKRKIPLKWLFLAHRDGLPPAQALSLFGPLARLHPTVWTLVTLPAWLESRDRLGSAERQPQEKSPALALEVSRRILGGLSRQLRGLAPDLPSGGPWSKYAQACPSYTEEGLVGKETTVAGWLQACRPATVLDLGCNTGQYSILAAKVGARVVALDSDSVCVERLFRAAETQGLDLQPLVVDLGRPSPPNGWNGQEELSLLARLENRFDCTIALALLHHLLVRERLGLETLAAFFARVTRAHLLLEWIPPEDPQFRSMAGPNQDLYRDLDWPRTLAALTPWFRLQTSVPIPGGDRCLHLFARLP